MSLPHRIKPRLLLVEDSPPLAALYSHYLEKLPVQLVAVATLAQARAALAEQRPQLCCWI